MTMTPTDRASRKSGWAIAQAWYSEDQIIYAVQHAGIHGNPPIPSDVTSAEFGTWLTHQYRLAMAKGIQLGREGSED